MPRRMSSDVCLVRISRCRDSRLKYSQRLRPRFLARSMPAVAALTDDVAYGLGSLAVVLWIGAALLLAGVVWL